MSVTQAGSLGLCLFTSSVGLGILGNTATSRADFPPRFKFNKCHEVRLTCCLSMTVLLNPLCAVVSVLDDFVILSPHHRGARGFLKMGCSTVSVPWDLGEGLGLAGRKGLS